MGCSQDDVHLVLESDGTYVDDDEYLRWLPDNTAFLLLRSGESWSIPIQRNACTSREQASDGWSSLANSPIPRVVCETLNTLDIYHEPPFWKIVDNRGKITLVLHWDQPRNNHGRYVAPVHSQEFANSNFDGNKIPVPVCTTHSVSDIKIKSKDLVADEKITSVSPAACSGQAKTSTNVTNPSSQVKIKSVNAKTAKECKSGASYANSVSQAEGTNIPLANSGKEYARSNFQPASQHNLEKCEFHCGSLHEEGRSIRSAECRNRHRIHSMSKILKSSHVHFCDEALNTIDSSVGWGSRASLDDCRSSKEDALLLQETTELEVEQESNNIDDELENVTSEKLLLLTDQLSNDKHKHLTILDLGVILERLKAKIIDVHRLEREREDLRCYRWTISATIRGEVLRDLGVLYNGNYYSISESPSTSFPLRDFHDDEEDREDSV